ncbi:MAG TPA: hypothetical protein ENG66_04150 [Thermococcus sp.]|nr:hypothetical protein [Thermococcus sp.]
MKKAKIEIVFDCEEEAKLVENSVKPEVMDNVPKSKVGMQRESNLLFLFIESEDVSSLRAACNSYLKWMDTVIRLRREMENLRKTTSL